MFPNCDSRISPVDKMNKVLAFMREEDQSVFVGYESLRSFMRKHGVGEKNGYMDVMLFLSLAEQDGRLFIDRAETKTHYTTAYCNTDVFKIDTTERPEQHKALEHGAKVIAEGRPALVVGVNTQTVTEYEVYYADGSYETVDSLYVQSVDELFAPFEA